jgi:hypothetical protein
MSKRLCAFAGVLLSLAAVAVVPLASSAADRGTFAEREVARCGKCGDGYCNPSCGENQFTCPRDCAVSAE